MSFHHNLIIDYLFKLVPSLIATVAVIISLNQYRMVKEKLRLDLYNRRFAIYETSISVYHLLGRSKEVIETEESSDLWERFIYSVRESRFLFDEKSKISELMEKLSNQAFKVRGHKVHGHMLLSDKQAYQKSFDDSQAAYFSIDNTLLEIESAMKPYLDFHKL